MDPHEENHLEALIKFWRAFKASDQLHEQDKAFLDQKGYFERDSHAELGLQLAILSNGEPKMLDAAAKSAGIYGLLDKIISIEEVKIFKPSPRVYNLVAERMKVSNAELGFVSSNNWDCNGAGSAGLFTFWIQRSGVEPAVSYQEELGIVQ